MPNILIQIDLWAVVDGHSGESTKRNTDSLKRSRKCTQYTPYIYIGHIWWIMHKQTYKHTFVIYSCVGRFDKFSFSEDHTPRIWCPLSRAHAFQHSAIIQSNKKANNSHTSHINLLVEIWVPWIASKQQQSATIYRRRARRRCPLSSVEEQILANMKNLCARERERREKNRFSKNSTGAVIYVFVSFDHNPC